MTDGLITHLVMANLAGGAAIVLVLALRRPARNLTGARAAYALWLAVPAAMLATLIPARTVITLIQPAAVPVFPGPFVLHEIAPAPVVEAPVLPVTLILTLLWLAGITVSLVLLIAGQRRALARFGALTPEAPGQARAANPDVGPALLGVFRPRLVLPADFERRYDPAEQAMILAHERTHLTSAHPLANGLVAALRTLNWFNPLFHFAARYVRIDQELACDAAVMARHPGQRRVYARALLKTQLAAQPLPLGCYWPERSPGVLEARIAMLAASRPGPARLAVGAAAAAMLTVTAGLAAWAAQPPREEVRVASTPAGLSVTGQNADAPSQISASSSLPDQLSLTNAGGEVAVFSQNEPVIAAASENGQVGDSATEAPAATELSRALAEGSVRRAAELGASAAEIVRIEQRAGRFAGLDPDSATVVVGPSGVEAAYALQPLPPLEGVPEDSRTIALGGGGNFYGPDRIVIGPAGGRGNYGDRL